MASVFGHVAASSALGYAFFRKETRPATYILAGFLAFLPDLDVLAFRFGISYGSQWGHRGWTHSLLFTALVGLFTALIFNAFQKEQTRSSSFRIILWFVVSAVSHPVLDMMTNGGRGCAFWWPFSVERIFLPWRPILVSPLGAGAFFSEWGLRVLFSELIWIGLPGILLALLSRKGAKVFTRDAGA